MSSLDSLTLTLVSGSSFFFIIHSKPFLMSPKDYYSDLSRLSHDDDDDKNDWDDKNEKTFSLLFLHLLLSFLVSWQTKYTALHHGKSSDLHLLLQNHHEQKVSSFCVSFFFRLVLLTGNLDLCYSWVFKSILIQEMTAVTLVVTDSIASLARMTQVEEKKRHKRKFADMMT